MNDRENALRRTEMQVSQFESNLLTATTVLLKKEREWIERLERLKAEAHSLKEPSFQTRLGALNLPPGQLESHWDAALKARDEALKLRAKADERLKEAIAAHHAAVQSFAQNIQQAELALQSHLKAAAARRPEEKAAERPAATRNQARVALQTSVDLQSDSNFFTGFSANISDGGIFIATPRLLPIGTEIDLAFTLPSGEKIRAPGIVRWVREVNDETPDVLPGIGIQFVKMNAQVEAAIKRFVASREPLFFPG